VSGDQNLLVESSVGRRELEDQFVSLPGNGDECSGMWFRVAGVSALLLGVGPVNRAVFDRYDRACVQRVEDSLVDPLGQRISRL
jgi:hypothetical protein